MKEKVNTKSSKTGARVSWIITILSLLAMIAAFVWSGGK